MAETKKKTKRVSPPVQGETQEILAANLGNGYTNWVASTGKRGDFRSVTARVSKANRLVDLNAENVIVLDGELIAFGEYAYRAAPYNVQEQTRINRYTEPLYRELMACALYTAFSEYIGTQLVYPRVMIDVPAQVYKQTAIVDRIKANLQGQYRIGNPSGGELVLDVQHLTIVPEGIGAYFYEIFGAGNDQRVQNGTWVFLDIGYLTSDVVIVRDADYLSDAARSDPQLGISRVAEQVLEFIHSETGVLLQRAEIDRALNCPSVEVNGVQVDYSVARDAALQQLAYGVVEFLRQSIKGLNVRGIKLVGGGAEYLMPHLRQGNGIPPIMMAANPRRVNVEGLYAYLASEN